MHPKTQVLPWDTLDRVRQGYDCFVATTGFESRAPYFARVRNIQAVRKVAPAFSERHVLAFQQNRRWFMDAGFEVEEVRDQTFPEWMSSLVASLAPCEGQPLRVCVDISSLSRFRLATMIDAVRGLTSRFSVEVDFAYSVAAFSPPPKEAEPNVAFGPVVPGFAGWSCRPEDPTSVVVGVGFERDKALGAIEHINPAEVWSFKPADRHRGYSRAVEKANEELWNWIQPNRQFTYSVYDPFECLSRLESLSSGVIRSRKLVLLPFGPKVFALSCLLVACIHSEIGVWRVSSEQQEQAVDRKPNHKLVGLRTIFTKT